MTLSDIAQEINNLLLSQSVNVHAVVFIFRLPMKEVVDEILYFHPFSNQ